MIIRHLIALGRYYLGKRRISIPSARSLPDSLTALKAHRAAADLFVRVAGNGQVCVNSTRHYGQRGRPLIPFLRGSFRSSDEGIALEGTIAIEPCARTMVILFAVVILMMWAAIANDSALAWDHILAGALTTAIYWGFLELGYWVGKQDIEHIMDQVSKALAPGHNPARA